MSIFIPNITPPLPDEMLYSWVVRLAKVNGMPPLLFYRTYFFNENNQYKIIPANIKGEFLTFYDNLSYDIAPHKLYFYLTTMSLDLSALTKNLQNRIIVDFFNKQTKYQGNTLPKFKTLNMCSRCMKEDAEKYGETYVHRSHNIFGTKVCHIHHEPLQIIHDNGSGLYSQTTGSYEFFREYNKECEYAEYAHYLLKNRFQANIDIITNLIYEKLPESRQNKSFLAGMCLVNLGVGEIDTLKRNNDTQPFNANEIIFLLQQFFKNPDDVIKLSKSYKIAVAEKCEMCGKYYYADNNKPIEDILCPHCNPIPFNIVM